MAFHLPPANIQNECFSERSHLMFCSHDTRGGIALSKTEDQSREGEVHPGGNSVCTGTRLFLNRNETALPLYRSRGMLPVSLLTFFFVPQIAMPK